MIDSILSSFHPIVRSWFERTFGRPTAPQELGWKPISEGRNTLIVAPTGTGKTIAAFLWCINHLIEDRINGEEAPVPGVSILYISPLKALNNDIHRNLEEPLAGIQAEGDAQGVSIPRIRSAVRTGDTTQSQRRGILTHPPDILITTPESLYLMLTSKKARKIFSTVRYVIVDEIHSLAPTKRGVHLSLSLERLEAAAAASPVRIGLSATQKPLATIAHFLCGNDITGDTCAAREVAIVDAGLQKEMDVRVQCVAHDFSDLPRDSVWPLIYPELIKAIGRHRTTLIFVNNRRLAERIAAKLNEILSGTEETFNLSAVPQRTRRGSLPEAFPGPDGLTIQAYHSSMSRAAREQMEHQLKAGSLRALVATSSLELGIDIGSVDLVIQLQSPKGIARGLQRIGRSGHVVHAVSKGRLFPTHREDLVECAVIAKEMLSYHIETSRIPANCLDVLAQQIVACVSIEEWNADDLFDLVRQSSCYETLTRDMFIHVVEMLAGRYTSESFRELRSRIVYDKQRNMLSALPGSSHQAIMGAGTIPDRGYYGVYLTDKKTKIGDVDEEFIYESRTGDTFILGSNVWRMVDIDANRILVEPAPGQPARMPFWKGEGIGRTFELSVKIGEFREFVSNSLSRPGGSETGPTGSRGASTDDALEADLRSAYSLDLNAARNIVGYIREQRDATAIVPTHNHIVVEGFRDEIGDPRIVVHSCFGRSVNALLGIILKKSLTEQLGIDVQMLSNDDGILFRCADVERLPLDIFSSVNFLRAQESIVEDLPSSPLFASLFRQNAERALLLPKALPGKRTPLWLQRLRAGDLLQIVRRSNDFPIVIETYRDCLNDVLDLEHFKEVLARVEAGEISVHTVEREVPSPFAMSILFEFIAVYMYAADQSKQSGPTVPVNTDLLRDVVDLDTVSSVLSPVALAKIEEQLQFTAPTRRARSAAECFDIILRLGELTHKELEVRTDDPGFIRQLLEQGSIAVCTIGGTEFYVAAEEQPLYEAAFSPGGGAGRVGVAGMIDSNEARVLIALRSLRTRGIVTDDFFSDRYHIAVSDRPRFLAHLEEQDDVVRGHFTAPDKNEWCSRSNLERIHRASLSLKRREITPATLPQFAEFLTHWQHRHPSSAVRDEQGFRQILDQLIGLALPQEVWENEIFAPRMNPYDPHVLRRMTQHGELLCLGNETGKISWFLRGEGALYLDEDVDTRLAGLSHTAKDLYGVLTDRGALFLSDMRTMTVYTLAALNKALAELFWTGLITNDSADEVLKIKKFRAADASPFPDEKIALIAPSRNPLRFAAARSVRDALRNAPGWNGRWSVLHQAGVLGPALSTIEKAQRQTEQLLLRYGIVAREVAKRESTMLPWSVIAFQLQRMEMRGEIRRGYFVEGLSGMQFALPGAHTLLQSLRTSSAAGPPVVINACDPALPYGQGIEAGGEMRLSRLPQNYCALVNGEPLAWFEQFGMRIATAPDSPQDAVQEALVHFVAHMRSLPQRDRTSLTVEYCNETRPSASPLEPLLRAVGFYRDKVQTMRLDLF
jgi:ATP-dependent helicase Lhr and Lhr-like helicase